MRNAKNMITSLCLIIKRTPLVWETFIIKYGTFRVGKDIVVSAILLLIRFIE